MILELEACARITLSRARSCLMAAMYNSCTDLLEFPLLYDAALLLVELVGALLELFFAGWLAEVVGDHRARVGLVVLEGGGAAAGSLCVNIVDFVRGCVRVAGLLCDLVGDAYTTVNHPYFIRLSVGC